MLFLHFAVDNIVYFNENNFLSHELYIERLNIKDRIFKRIDLPTTNAYCSILTTKKEDIVVSLIEKNL